jgi:pSer/pThr/pTyr-binding forkhead associated (FHA) protein
MMAARKAAMAARSDAFALACTTENSNIVLIDKSLKTATRAVQSVHGTYANATRVFDECIKHGDSPAAARSQAKAFLATVRKTFSKFEQESYAKIETQIEAKYNAAMAKSVKAIMP